MLDDGVGYGSRGHHNEQQLSFLTDPLGCHACRAKRHGFYGTVSLMEHSTAQRQAGGDTARWDLVAPFESRVPPLCCPRRSGHHQGSLLAAGRRLAGGSRPAKPTAISEAAPVLVQGRKSFFERDGNQMQTAFRLTWPACTTCVAVGAVSYTYAQALKQPDTSMPPFTTTPACQREILLEAVQMAQQTRAHLCLGKRGQQPLCGLIASATSLQATIYELAPQQTLDNALASIQPGTVGRTERASARRDSLAASHYMWSYGSNCDRTLRGGAPSSWLGSRANPWGPRAARSAWAHGRTQDAAAPAQCYCQVRMKARLQRHTLIAAACGTNQFASNQRHMRWGPLPRTGALVLCGD